MVQKEFGFLQLLAIIVRHRRVVLGLPAIAIALAVAYALLAPKSYAASVAFVPDQGGGRSLPAGLAGLAGQFGVAVGGGPSSRLLAEVAKSDTIKRRLLHTTFEFDGRRQTLASILYTREVDAAVRDDRAMRKLNARLSTAVDAPSGVVRVAVRMPTPALAASVADSLLEFTVDANIASRQAAARERAAFIEERTAQAGLALYDAEERLKRFMLGNRAAPSPSLRLESERLQREIDLRQSVFSGLSRELETARIEQLNSMMNVTVVDRATIPVRAATPQLRPALVLAMLAGVFAAAVYIILAEGLASARRREDPALAQIAAAWRPEHR
jgi:uncharacterized protein involved in exopolysaccharide biosynthesis